MIYKLYIGERFYLPIFDLVNIGVAFKLGYVDGMNGTMGKSKETFKYASTMVYAGLNCTLLHRYKKRAKERIPYYKKVLEGESPNISREDMDSIPKWAAYLRWVKLEKSSPEDRGSLEEELRREVYVAEEIAKNSSYFWQAMKVSSLTHFEVDIAYAAGVLCSKL